MYLLGQSSHISAMANLKGYPYSDACFEKVEKGGKMMKLLDSVLISNFLYNRNGEIRKCLHDIAKVILSKF